MEDLYKMFVAERHREVLEASQSGDVKPDDLVAVIGSLCAVGHCDIADVLIKQIPLDRPEQLAESLMYLSAARTRQREFSLARRHLGELLRVSRASPAVSVNLAKSIALGNYRFYQGRLGSALFHGSRALETAVELGDPYSRLLAYDLVASIHAKRRSYKSGMFYFGRAIGCAARLGRQRHGRSLGVALAIHMSQSGPEHVSVPEFLILSLSTLEHSRPFSRASLLLEIARQWINRGGLDKARHSLDEAFDIIDPAGDIRYSALLAQRFAELELASGHSRAALLHLEHAELLLESGIDDLLIADSLQLKCLALSRLRRTDEVARIQLRFEALSKRLDTNPRSEDSTWHGESLPIPVNDLNSRQQQILQYLARNAYINVAEYKVMFRVSDITACRDLSHLTKAGILNRVGRARATRYALKSLLH